MAESIRIEVVYATPERQTLMTLSVPTGTRLDALLQKDEVVAQWPELNLAEMPVGIFGKVVSDRGNHVLRDGERIEIYRPLLIDPKEVRRLRAAKATAERAKPVG